MGYKCVFCGREISNKGSYVAHEMSCRSNPERVSQKRSPNAGAQKGNVPWNKGLTAETDPRIVKIAAKNAYSRKGKPGKLHTDETKRKMSESRKKLYEMGWESTAGRTKKYATTLLSQGMSLWMDLGS